MMMLKMLRTYFLVDCELLILRKLPCQLTRRRTCSTTRVNTRSVWWKWQPSIAVRVPVPGPGPACNFHVTSNRYAGHSKWANIKRQKTATDLEKSKMRGKMVEQIRSAVANGGPDPSNNVKLSGLLAKAKSIGLPRSNIENALKATGSSVGKETVMYEGRGPSGYFVLIEALTDNRKRTRPELRRIMEKQG